jgi:hypothetical protein
MTSNQLDNPHGFNVGTMPNGEKILKIESARLDDCIKYLVEKKIKHIQVFYFTGYTHKDLDFLDDVGDLIEGVTIDESVDFSGLSRNRNLRELVIYNERQAIDISIFPSLGRSFWVLINA